MSDLYDEVWRRLKLASQAYAGEPSESEGVANSIIDGLAPGIRSEAREFYISEFCAMVNKARK